MSGLLYHGIDHLDHELMTLEKFIKNSRKLRYEGISLEDMLAYLKAEGVNIVDSLKIVRVVENVGLGKAKEIIDNSETWANLSEINNDIRSVAERSLRDS